MQESTTVATHAATAVVTQSIEFKAIVNKKNIRYYCDRRTTVTNKVSFFFFDFDIMHFLLVILFIYRQLISTFSKSKSNQRRRGYCSRLQETTSGLHN